VTGRAGRRGGGRGGHGEHEPAPRRAAAGARLYNRSRPRSPGTAAAAARGSPPPTCGGTRRVTAGTRSATSSNAWSTGRGSRRSTSPSRSCAASAAPSARTAATSSSTTPPTPADEERGYDAFGLIWFRNVWTIRDFQSKYMVRIQISPNAQYESFRCGCASPTAEWTSSNAYRGLAHACSDIRGRAVIRH
jgi:hypothetical protein